MRADFESQKNAAALGAQKGAAEGFLGAGRANTPTGFGHHFTT